MKVLYIVLIAIIVGAILITYFNLKDKAAISFPPFFTYIKPEYRDNEEVIEHEKCHEEQYKRMGFIKFYTTYFKQQFKGYEKSELEKECYSNDYQPKADYPLDGTILK